MLALKTIVGKPRNEVSNILANIVHYKKCFSKFKYNLNFTVIDSLYTPSIIYWK